jgi:hypothetical protein
MGGRLRPGDTDDPLAVGLGERLPLGVVGAREAAGEDEIEDTALELRAGRGRAGTRGRGRSEPCLGGPRRDPADGRACAGWSGASTGPGSSTPAAACRRDGRRDRAAAAPATSSECLDGATRPPGGGCGSGARGRPRVAPPSVDDCHLRKAILHGHQFEQHRQREVTEGRDRPTGLHRRQPSALRRQTDVADGVDAPMDAMQAPRRETPADRVVRQPARRSSPTDRTPHESAARLATSGSDLSRYAVADLPTGPGSQDSR